MKALFLIFHGFSEFNGISKKIHYQVEALKKCNVETHLSYLRYEKDFSHTRMVDDLEIKNFPSSIWGKVEKRVYYSSLLKYIKTSDYDFVYIRYANNANPFLNKFIKKLKAEDLKLIMEIPTFPYDDEYKKSPLFDKIVITIDKLYRMSLAKNIDYIVSYTDLKTIFGRPVINISNGIDFDKIPIKKHINDNKNYIRLIGVAEIHYWHGFSRLIRGIADYYKSTEKEKNRRDVFFDVIGYAADTTLKELKDLVSKNGLEKNVIFHGPKFGEELDGFFEKADFGIASLGRHRSGIYDIKTLKNREYAARGIPFIYSENDSDFDGKPYVLKCSPDESAVDIKSIINFYEKNKLSPTEIRESIKDLSWNNQMRKVVDNIK